MRLTAPAPSLLTRRAAATTCMAHSACGSGSHASYLPRSPRLDRSTQACPSCSRAGLLSPKHFVFIRAAETLLFSCWSM